MNSVSIRAANVRDIYCGVGRYEFKVIVDQTAAPAASVNIILVDPDGRQRPVEVRRWGTKYNCSFEVTDDMPDGVLRAYVEVGGSDDVVASRTIEFWIIK